MIEGCYTELYLHLSALRALHLARNSYSANKPAGIMSSESGLCAYALQHLQLTELCVTGADFSRLELQRIHAGYTHQFRSTLKKLELRNCARLDPSLLDAEMVDLQHLDLASSTITGSPAIASGDRALLYALSELLGLQHLGLQGCLSSTEGVSAASYTALTLSTQLTLLDLQDCILPQGAMQHMFGSSSPMPVLQVLLLGASTGPPAPAPVGGNGAPQVSTAGLSQADVVLIAEACPALTTWQFRLDAAAATAFRPGDDLVHLLPHLTSLGFNGCRSWGMRSLGQLAGLQHLCLVDSNTMEPTDLMHLTALKELQHLEVHGSKEAGQAKIFLASKVRGTELWMLWPPPEASLLLMYMCYKQQSMLACCEPRETANGWPPVTATNADLSPAAITRLIMARHLCGFSFCTAGCTAACSAQRCWHAICPTQRAPAASPST